MSIDRRSRFLHDFPFPKPGEPPWYGFGLVFGCPVLFLEYLNEGDTLRVSCPFPILFGLDNFDICSLDQPNSISESWSIFFILSRRLIFLSCNLVEIIELENHPWFLGCQFHPELKSRVNKAHPLFREFIKSSIIYKNSNVK